MYGHCIAAGCSWKPVMQKVSTAGSRWEGFFQLTLKLPQMEVLFGSIRSQRRFQGRLENWLVMDFLCELCTVQSKKAGLGLIVLFQRRVENGTASATIVCVIIKSSNNLKAYVYLCHKLYSICIYTSRLKSSKVVSSFTIYHFIHKTNSAKACFRNKETLGFIGAAGLQDGSAWRKTTFRTGFIHIDCRKLCVWTFWLSQIRWVNLGTGRLPTLAWLQNPLQLMLSSNPTQGRRAGFIPCNCWEFGMSRPWLGEHWNNIEEWHLNL